MNAEFRAYFAELYNGWEPFPWQDRLLRMVTNEGWPDVIDLPTSAGKTSCVDVALFALASGVKTPRRIFFVVDRRIIVDHTFTRYRSVAQKLAEAKNGPLAEVAAALRKLACVEPEDNPLDVHQLRGGIYQDQSWVSSVLQPTIVTSTVDQVGSRLLFRGYGVSPNTWPIHAGLIANDALIFLDEAHCSRAFSQTLKSIRNYRSAAWSKEDLGLPFTAVEMTATPTSDGEAKVFSLVATDRAKSEILRKRLTTSKPVSLHAVSAKPDDAEAIAKALVAQTLDMLKAGTGTRYAVIANRIATARLAHKLLQDHFAKEFGDLDGSLSLLIGRMRPLDRDDQRVDLQCFEANPTRERGTGVHILVSTQCVEVGADLDFDAVVTECASIDALLQRFGRLDRLGLRQGEARGAVVMPVKGIGAKIPDPIYGRAVEETWTWLTSQTENACVDFGIENLSKESIPQKVRALPAEQSHSMKRLGESAPALLPAHLDALCQTSPTPHVEPSISLFLHGAASSVPDVQVVWRADIDRTKDDSITDEQFQERWKKTVALCPPNSAEAMPVRFSTLLRWVRSIAVYEKERHGVGSDLHRNGSKSGVADALDGVDADLEGLPEVNGSTERHDHERETDSFLALIWRGAESLVIRLNDRRELAMVRPGDTLVVPSSYPRWEILGHIPRSGLTKDGCPIDFGDRAALLIRHRAVLRLHPDLLAQWPEDNNESRPRKALEERVREPEILEEPEVIEALSLYADQLVLPEWLERQIQAILAAKNWQIVRHPSGSGATLIDTRSGRSIAEDSGNDESSFQTPIFLEDHLDSVRQAAVKVSSRLLPAYHNTFARAAELHDVGKVDKRFQALLRGGDLLAATMALKPLAKAEFRFSAEFQQLKKKSNLPDGFRHELVSLLFGQADEVVMPSVHRELMLHLIASHHGRCRPFAPVVLDANPPTLLWNTRTVSSVQRVEACAHRLDSGIARRYWNLTRHYGWWGLPFLEAAFRICDWAASSSPSNASCPKEEPN